MDSLESADAWRLAHSTRGVGFRTKKPAPEAADPKEVPEFLRKNEERAEPDPEEQANTRKKTKLLSTLASSLQASIEVESEALRLVQEAQKRKENDCLPLRIAAYNKAKEGRMQSERLVRAFELETKTLITWDFAVDMASRFMVPLITRLRALSRRLGPMVNPADPLWAEEILAREFESVIAEGQKLYVKATDPA